MRLTGYTILIACLCTCFHGHAQSISDEQAEIIEAMLDSAEYYELIAPKRTLAITQNVLSTLPVMENEIMYVRALLHAATGEKMLSRKDEAMALTNRAIAISNEVDHPELKVRSYYMKATIFGQYDQSDSSLIYYQKVVELHYPGLSPYFVSTAYTDMGRINRLMGDLQQAEMYLLKSYQLSSGHEMAKLSALAELIALYSDSDNPKYLAYLDTLAMSDFYRRASEISFMAHFDSFLRLDNASEEEKEKKLREVYTYSLTTTATVNQISYGIKLYQLLDRQQRYAEAHELLLELLQKAISTGHGKHMKALTQELYKNSKKRGDIDEAFTYLERYSELRDSLMSDENMQRLGELNVKFETAQKDLEIERQKNSLEQARRKRIFLIVLSGLIGVLALVTFVYFRNRARSTRRIADQEKVIHAQEKIKLLHEREVAELTASLETQEKERNRIARDLHDGLGSLMSGISAQVETLRAQPQVAASGSVYLTQLRDMVNEATGELRRTSYELMPASLLRQGLEPAMRDLCVNLLVKNGIEPALEINADLTFFTHEQQLTLYRITQELLNNIVKHANASHVLIQLNHYEDEISLVVEDDGKGFDVESKKQQGGLGLGSLQSRVNLLKGFLDIASIPGEGTTVTVNFKVAESQMGRMEEGERITAVESPFDKLRDRS